MGIVHPLAFASPGLLPPGALTVPHDQARRAGINRRSPDPVVLAPGAPWERAKVHGQIPHLRIPRRRIGPDPYALPRDGDL